MKCKCKQYGITLTETVTVVGIVALLAVFSMPALRGFLDSQSNQVAAETLISSALSSARAIAAKNQRYAGIRFQHEYDANAPNEMGSQYMIFIIHDFDNTNLAPGFRAVEGIEPIKLPDNIGVMEAVTSNNELDNDVDFNDVRTFSVFFSSAGKLVIRDVRTRNRDGVTNNNSFDDVFNTYENVTATIDSVGMFIQDDYPGYGYKEEASVNSFYVYNRRVMDSVEPDRRYSDYLEIDLEPVYINPYTGTIIKTKR